MADNDPYVDDIADSISQVGTTPEDQMAMTTRLRQLVIGELTRGVLSNALGDIDATKELRAWLKDVDKQSVDIIRTKIEQASNENESKLVQEIVAQLSKSAPAGLRHTTPVGNLNHTDMIPEDDMEVDVLEDEANTDIIQETREQFEERINR